MDNERFQASGAWYAVFTRSRAEKACAAVLSVLGIPYFLPLITEKRRWSDRIQKVTVPLFPSYLFVNITDLAQDRNKVLSIAGVAGFVGNHHGPQVVSDLDLENVRMTLSHCVQCTPCQLPVVGERVRVAHGLLAGVQGTLIRSGPATNLVISVETIQQAFSIHVDSADVEPLSVGFHLSNTQFSNGQPGRRVRWGRLREQTL